MIIDKKDEISNQISSAQKGHVTRSKINPETGLNIYQETNIRKVKALKEKINEETGLPHYESVGKKITEAYIKDPSINENKSKKQKEKGNSIDPATGKRFFDLWAEIRQANKLKKTPEELALAKAKKSESVLKALEKMKNTFEEYGGEILSKKEIANRKRLVTYYETKDEDGMTSFDKVQSVNTKCPAIRIEGTNLFYQGSAEREFLENLFFEYGTEWVIANVQRGPMVKYFDPYQNKIRRYFPDFLVNYSETTKIVYEIKSGYTFDNDANDMQLRHINYIKLATAIK